MDLLIKDRTIMQWTTCLSYLYKFFYDYQILSCDLWPTFNISKMNRVTKKGHAHKYNMKIQAPNSHTIFLKRKQWHSMMLCVFACVIWVDPQLNVSLFWQNDVFSLGTFYSNAYND
jgi:hypothetical protein